MSIEFSLLLYSVGLTFVLIMIPATVGMLANGLPWAAGNRDAQPEASSYCKRTLRLRDNMLENMALFAPIVLIAAAMDVSNAATVLGAQLFFYARVGHAIVYLAGWPWVRTLLWAAGVVGTAMIAIELL
jgi:uncharacterized MAPEG superfamily protein